MAFESKRLRVQLPCSPTTLVDERAQVVPATFCAIPSLVMAAPNDCCGFFSCFNNTLGGFTDNNWSRNEVPQDEGDENDPQILDVTEAQLSALRRQLEMKLSVVVEAEQKLAELQGDPEGAG